MTDNFRIAYKYIDEFSADRYSFFLVEILKRKKENPHLKSDIVLKRMHVKNSDALRRAEQDLKEYAFRENARIIFHINAKNEKVLALDLLKELANRISTEDFNNIHRLSDSLVAAQKTAYTKRWLLDVDKNDMTSSEFQTYKNNVRELVMSVREDQEVIEFPTPNGAHLIVLPFNSDLLWDEFPEILIHKNNATVLFADTHRLQ